MWLQLCDKLETFGSYGGGSIFHYFEERLCAAPVTRILGAALQFVGFGRHDRAEQRRQLLRRDGKSGECCFHAG